MVRLPGLGADAEPFGAFSEVIGAFR